MADDDEDDYTKSRRNRQSWPRKEEKEPPEWNETCIGVWTKDTEGKDWKKAQICNGICIVKINKNMDPAKVKPSTTRGLQIIVTEMGGPFENQKDEEIGTDGVFSGYRPTQAKMNKKESSRDNTTLIEDVLASVADTKDAVGKRLEKYHDDPAAVKELWTELVDGSKQQYYTTKRLLSYVQPKERMIELKDIAVDFCKDFWNWVADRKGR